MFISAVNIWLWVTLILLFSRVFTMHIVEKYPGSSAAKALSFIYG